MPTFPYIEAEYEDGYIHREDEQDHSPYVPGKNIFNDILEKRPVAAHGRMVRFSLVTKKDTYSIDWTKLPDNARPVRFRHMERDIIASSDGSAEWSSEPRVMGIDFGYQYTDEAGKNHQEVKEIR